MKNQKNILIIVVVVLLCLTFVKDFFIKTAITSVGSKIVGAPITMSYFSLGLLTQKVHIKNFKLYNPPGFPNEPMVDLPEVRVDVDVFSFLKGKMHAPLIVFNLKEMSVVKNKEGKLNVDSLKIVEDQKAAADAKKKAPKDEPVAGAKPSEIAIQIDLLRLNVERVVFKDMTKEPAAVQVYEVALKDKEFKDITSVQQMVTLVMIQAMGPTAVQSAGMYAAATILGVGFLPAGIIGAVVAKDDAAAEFKTSFNSVYDETIRIIKSMGVFRSEDRKSGTVKGKIDGADVTVKIENISGGKVKATATARQIILPKPEIAGGVIYKLKQVFK